MPRRAVWIIDKLFAPIEQINVDELIEEILSKEERVEKLVLLK